MYISRYPLDLFCAYKQLLHLQALLRPQLWKQLMNACVMPNKFDRQMKGSLAHMLHICGRSSLVFTVL